MYWIHVLICYSNWVILASNIPDDGGCKGQGLSRNVGWRKFEKLSQSFVSMMTEKENTEM